MFLFFLSLQTLWLPLLAPTPAFISVPEFFSVSPATCTAAAEFPPPPPENRRKHLSGLHQEQHSAEVSPLVLDRLRVPQPCPALPRNEDSRTPSSKVQKPKQLASAK